MVVIDKAVFPRDKFCGDGLTAGALRHLEALGLDPLEVASWHRVDDIVVHGPNGREVEFPLPRDQGQFAVVARRFDLDHALVKRARHVGATIHDGHAFRSITVRDDHVEVIADGLEPLSGAIRDRCRRYVVAAAQSASARRHRTTWASGTRSASTSPT